MSIGGIDIYDLTVVIPTYNEGKTVRCNILKLENFLFDSDINAEILVIDDNSTDNTVDEVKLVTNYRENVRMFLRDGERDLVRSVLFGIKNANADIVVVIDADLAQDYTKILDMYNHIKYDNYDIVAGSRFAPGATINGCSFDRKVLSVCANTIEHLIFPYISDFGGFFAVRKDVCKDIPDYVRGQKALLEIVDKGSWKKSMNLPYNYTCNKMPSVVTFDRITEYFLQLVSIVLGGILYRTNRAWEEIKNITRFTIVGVFGIFVDLVLIFLLTDIFHIYYFVSGVIGTELSLLTNFVINDRWSFRGKMANGLKNRIVLFHKISFGGIVIKLTVLYTLTTVFGVYYLLSSVIGLGFAYGWNMMMNRRYTWC